MGQIFFSRLTLCNTHQNLHLVVLFYHAKFHWIILISSAPYNGFYVHTLLYMGFAHILCNIMASKASALSL